MDTQTATKAIGGDAPPTVLTLRVEDTTATPEYPSRTHDIMIGEVRKPITFKYGEPLELPVDVALKFLKDEAFVVTDPRTGDRIEPTPHTPDAGESLSLGPDEVVARLSELHQGALLLRAMQLPGGDKFSKKTPRDVLTAFLTEHRTKAMVRSTVDAAGIADAEGLGGQGTQTIGGAMSEASLNKLFADVD